MVSSSKKKRGKERKAAAAVKNSADNIADDNRTTVAAAAAVGSSLQSLPVLRVPSHLARQQLSTKKKMVPSVAHIRKGRNFTTELAISTDKLHQRGPIGLQHLVTNKWYVYGNGQIR